MKNLRHWGAGLLLFASLAASSAQEVELRGGLPRTQKLLSSHAPLSVVYLGGSITEAGGGYCDQSAAWLKQHYPQSKIDYTNAGIGGTGSDFGVFRFDSEVLVHQPDLVFIEFAVNDYGADSLRILRAMEGMVRKVRSLDKRADLCFLYTLSEPMLAVMEKGEIPRTTRIMNQVANHYGIPSINFQPTVFRLHQSGQLTFKSKEPEAGKIHFSKDGVHPLPETGHKVYTKVFEKAFLALMQTKARPVTKALPRPLRKDHYAQARQLDMGQTERHGAWSTIEDGPIFRRYGKRYPSIWKGCAGGSSLTFGFNGSQFGFCDVVGPAATLLEIEVDGRSMPVDRFDEYCQYYRASYYLSPMLPEGEHVVTIRVAQTPTKKTELLRKRFSTAQIEKGEPYDEWCFFPINLLVLGTP